MPPARTSLPPRPQSSRATTEELDPARRIRENVLLYKALQPTLRGVSASGSRSKVAPGMVEVEPPISPGNHLLLHRRTWDSEELARRVRPASGAYTRRSASASPAAAGSEAAGAAVVREQLAVFHRQHAGEEDLDEEYDDDEDRAAKHAARETRRKLSLLRPTVRSGVRGRGSRANTLRATLVASESIVLKYLLMFDRAARLLDSISATRLQRFISVLERAECETVGRSSHERFRGMRKSTVLSYAVNGEAALPKAPSMAASSMAANSMRSTTSAPPAQQLLSRHDAEALYRAVDVLGEGYLALKPTLSVLRFHLGMTPRTPSTYIGIVLDVLADHNQSNVTRMDFLSLADCCRRAVAPSSVQLLAVTGGAAPTVSRRAVVQEEELLREISRLPDVVFTAEREALPWRDLAELLRERTDFPALLHLILSDDAEENGTSSSRA